VFFSIAFSEPTLFKAIWGRVKQYLSSSVNHTIFSKLYGATRYSQFALQPALFPHLSDSIGFLEIPKA
jgi:hypothetical protein